MMVPMQMKITRLPSKDAPGVLSLFINAAPALHQRVGLLISLSMGILLIPSLGMVLELHETLPLINAFLSTLWIVAIFKISVHAGKVSARLGASEPFLLGFFRWMQFAGIHKLVDIYVSAALWGLSLTILLYLTLGELAGGRVLEEVKEAYVSIYGIIIAPGLFLCTYAGWLLTGCSPALTLRSLYGVPMQVGVVKLKGLEARSFPLALLSSWFVLALIFILFGAGTLGLALGPPILFFLGAAQSLHLKSSIQVEFKTMSDA